MIDVGKLLEEAKGAVNNSSSERTTELLGKLVIAQAIDNLAEAIRQKNPCEGCRNYRPVHDPDGLHHDPEV